MFLCLYVSVFPLILRAVGGIIVWGVDQASKYIFYLHTSSGALYRPATRDFELELQEVTEQEKARLKAIWSYWQEGVGELDVEAEEGAHPDAFHESDA
jgi:hypothetical protein